MLDIPLLKKICETPGAPGFESRIRSLIRQEVESFADDVQIDNLGNLVVIKKGKSSDKKIMVAAHLDEISFIVTHIDDEGFLRFIPLGGFDPKTLTAQRVIVHGKKDVIGVMGCKPIHLMKPEDRVKVVPIEEYFIDLGMSRDKVVEIVNIGNPVTRERSFIEMGDCVNSKSLDNRVSVYLLLETFRKLNDHEIPFDFYGVFTVQEEVGIRGATTAAHTINPDFGIALDVTIAFDVPGSQAHERVTKLNKGTAIKIMDSKTISDSRMVTFMQDVAKRNKIKWQPEILPKGGTDAEAIQRSGKNGAITGAISIPTRHIHQVIEMAHKSDMSHTLDLLVSCIIELDQNKWSF